jgi:dTMP kinase
MLIVIDGVDGAGKTTQTKLLVKKLQKQNYRVATLDYPQYQNTFFGQAVKRFLDGEFGDIDEVDPHLAALLYALDRFETKPKLQNWLQKKTIVVLNRYVSSNLIHQASKLKRTARTRAIRWIETMEYTIFGMPKPDLVIYLHLPSPLAYALIEKRGNKKDIHEQSKKHLAKASQEGLRLAKKYKNWRLVSCSNRGKILTIEEVEKRIWKIVERELIDAQLSP